MRMGMYRCVYQVVHPYGKGFIGDHVTFPDSKTIHMAVNKPNKYKI